VNSPGTPGAALDDVRLLQRIARRDREAFSQLYDRYAGVLYSTVMRVLNNPDEANDLLQEVFVQVWDESTAYDPALGNPFNWALTMTRNKAIGRLRALRRQYAFFAEITGESEVETGDVSTTPGGVFTQGQAALVRAALATIPYEQRQAIEMAFLGGMSADQIAEALGQPIETITARIRRGMLRLREGLRQLS
jgi:RNA polymerase sigma-70 factor (ECF subfamily)